MPLVLLSLLYYLYNTPCSPIIVLSVVTHVHESRVHGAQRHEVLEVVLGRAHLAPRWVGRRVDPRRQPLRQRRVREGHNACFIRTHTKKKIQKMCKKNKHEKQTVIYEVQPIATRARKRN